MINKLLGFLNRDNKDSKNLAKMKKALHVNTKLIVSLAHSKSKDYYDSRIEDIDDNKIVITMPTRKTVPIPVSKGTRLAVSVLVSDGKITFNSKIQEIITEPIYMFLLNMPDDMKFEQLRSFYRMPVRLRVKEGIVDDLSAGGCRLITKDELYSGDSITLDFSDTAMNDVGRVKCRVIRVSPRPDGKFIVSLKFDELYESTENRIVRFIFKKQIELKKMSLE